METIQGILNLLSAYPLWAKLGMILSLAFFTFFTIVGHPGDTPSISGSKSLEQILATSLDRVEIQSSILSAEENFAQYIQQVGPRNTSISYVFDLRCGGHKFDAMVYSYNTPMNQSPHYLYVFDLYEVTSVDTQLIDNDWERVRQLRFNDLKTALSNVKGFSAPLEIVTDLSVDDTLYRPTLVYVQLTGRRELATKSQLDGLRARQQNATERDGLTRVALTYDGLSDGLPG